MNNEIETKIEAKVFKRLIEHLQNRTDVQNIDLMNLSGFVEIVFLDGILRQHKKMV